jgi:O-antigen/teichoic acid export membrane protein
VSEIAEGASSYRRILKSSSIIGGASFVNILIGLVRTKALAVLLGPTGVGLVSLYRGLLTTASAVATMGLDTVGTRQVAEANALGEERMLAVARRALFWGTLILASSGTAAVWILRKQLAERVLGSASDAGVVGWLSLGVAFAVVAATQGAQIQGMRRIGDMARVTVYGAAVNTIIGVTVIWRWGRPALVYYVLAVPIANFLFGYFYVSRLPKLPRYVISLREITDQWKFLARVGVAFMGGALAMSIVQLWIRVDVGNVLGARALGQFQASWTISTTYIGFVLNAMAADYYPRLTGVILDRKAATRLVNEQTEIALMLSAPVFLVMMGLAPWVIRVLYTADFAPAVGILRWQILSDVLKVAAWPLGFIFLAAGDGKTFFWTEVSALLVMGGTIAAFLRPIGLDITGIAYLACYIFYLPLMHRLGKARIGFEWTSSVARLLAVTFIACGTVGILASYTRWGVAAGCLTSAAFGIHAIGRLSHMSEIGGTAGRIGAMARRLTPGTRR